MKSASKSTFQATVFASCVFGVSIPAFMVLLNNFSQPGLLSQASGCAEDQVYRVSDQQCYVLQGE
jgi:hypothetical protein